MDIIDSGKSGFTLIELIVVLAVMGTVLFMTLPKFRALTFDDNSERQLNILLNTIRELKKKSVYEGTDYVLHLDTVKSVMWVTSESMVPEIMSRAAQPELKNKAEFWETGGKAESGQMYKAKEKATPLPESVYITGVEIYGVSSRNSQDEYRIRFSRHGYCDMALIHLKERSTGGTLTVVIEAFLSGTEIRRKYISFSQCS